MLDFIMTNFLVVIVQGDCSLLGAKLTKILIDVFYWIQIVVPILVVALGTADLASAVIAQDQSKMQKATSNVIKRVLVGVAIFFTPTIVGLLLDAASIGVGLCGVGG